jgi:hypothetical protein
MAEGQRGFEEGLREGLKCFSAANPCHAHNPEYFVKIMMLSADSVYVIS